MNASDLLSAVATFAGGPVGLIAKFASIAPTLMKYAGANDSAVNIATSVLSTAVGMTGAKTPDEAIATIQADAQKMAEFQLKINEQQASWDKLYIDDMENARLRDLELHKAGYVNKRANFLVVVALLVVVAILWIMIAMSNLDDFVKSGLMLILGRFLGYIDNIYNFEFGTTRSSQKKDDTINKLSSPA